jgi:hypothetical protein
MVPVTQLECRIAVVTWGRRCFRVLMTRQQTICNGSIRTLVSLEKLLYIWSHSSYNRVSLQKCAA